MLRMATSIATFGAFVLMTLVFGFFLWQTLFTPKEDGDREPKAKPAYEEQHSAKEDAFGGSAMPSPSKSATDEAIASYTKWVAIFTMFLVLATIGLFVSGERNVEVARRSANAANIAANVAQQTLIVTERPWIKVTDFKVEGDFLATRGEKVSTFFIYSFVLKNVGHSPAKNVQYFVETRPGFEQSRENLQKFCVASLEKRKKTGIFKSIFFPDDSSDPIKAMAIFANVGDDNIKLQGANAAVVFGCITYEFGFSDHVHTTSFGYGVGGGVFAPLDGTQLKLDKSQVPITREFDVAD